PSAGLNTIPQGCVNRATVGPPSTRPVAPLPANIVTFPEVSIFRITLLPYSTTYIFPKLSVAVLMGPLNWALVRYPLTNPAVPVPANVVTFEPSHFLIA